MPIVTLTVDEQKVRAFVDLERKANAIKDQKEKTEKAKDAATGEYNNARQAAFQGMAGWEAMGPLHIKVMQLSRDFERLSEEYNKATNELGQAKPVLIEEVLRSARMVVG